MKTALLFPGQGSQYVGMGKSLSEIPKAQEMLQQSSDILGFDFSKLLFEGPEETLKATQNTQPALFVVSMLVFECLLKGQVHFDYVMGHSLGEYSAICAAGGFTFEEGLKLVRLRGELMAEAGIKRPGAMAAVLGMDIPVLQEICIQASDQAGTVVIANFNSPAQLVISGEVAGVALAQEMASKAGAKKVVPLPVSGAFHSPLMEYALPGLQAGLAQVNFKDLQVPVVTNVDALPCTEANLISQSLTRQLNSSVRWVESIELILKDGVDQALEVGAGSVLMGVCRGISRNLKVTPIESPESFSKFKSLESVA